MLNFISICLSLSIFCSGLVSQIDYYIRPAKYHALKFDTAAWSLPEPLYEPTEDAYVQLSEITMHYMVYGAHNPPLVLIHGNAGDAYSLQEAAAYLANEYTVYMPESRCHGQSSDPDEISYRLMAKDLKEFIEAMQLEKPIIMGHSDGAINAITLAADYPDIPGAIISCGANSSPKQFKPHASLCIEIDNMSYPNKLNDLMLTLPDFTADYLSHITCPTYIVSGQYDIMWNADTLFIANSIPGSDMAILKGENHGSYISDDGKKAYILAHEWLEKLQ